MAHTDVCDFVTKMLPWQVTMPLTLNKKTEVKNGGVCVELEFGK